MTKEEADHIIETSIKKSRIELVWRLRNVKAFLFILKEGVKMSVIKIRNSTTNQWEKLPTVKGNKGDDGNTPVKGIDYFTQTDIDEIKAAILDAQNPVGTIRLTVTDTDPAEYLGVGTWIRIAKGRFLVGINEGDADFDSPGETGGSKYMQSHTHTIAGNSIDVEGTGTGVRLGASLGGSTFTTSTAGTGTENNLPPYFACYMWRRRA